MLFHNILQPLAALVAVAAPLVAAASDAAPQYLVTVKQDADLEAHTHLVSELHARNIARRDDSSTGVGQTFSFPGFQGYAGSFDDETLAMIKADPSVRGTFIRRNEDDVDSLYLGYCR
jgi:hypothetical protein